MIQCHALFIVPVLVRPVLVMPVRVPSVTPAYDNTPFNHTYPCDPLRASVSRYAPMSL